VEQAAFALCCRRGKSEERTKVSGMTFLAENYTINNNASININK